MDDALGKLSYIWTTEKENWWLVRNRDNNDYLILYVSENTHADLIIEDDALHDLVVRKMIEAGCVQMTSDEYYDYFESATGLKVWREKQANSDIE